jgi:murein peptide amidase A
MIELVTNQHTSAQSKERRSISDLLAPLQERAMHSPSLLDKPMSKFEIGGEDYSVPRFLFLGPQGGAEPIRIGIFAAIHGDEPATASGLVKFVELLDQLPVPELARDFCLFIYPVCNPTGYEDNTRTNRRGRDLNREFWNNSSEPEVQSLQTELYTHAFDGIISLHSDDTTDGVYGFVRGATLTKALVEPALQAAELFLPRNNQAVIDGFEARNGIIRHGYNGILSAPPKVNPRPFEIVFETPQLAPVALQEQAFTVALLSILSEYRKMISYAANL